ncbi:MAG: 5'-nucleotidase, lipoprotein e(P4) family [Candidatus Caenarcaniphilales bacterium]|nr:5'-nucleotidase, lipoprotein e(P4) family [Candidatus Caenarcaniphilales bacterium]
MQKKLIYLVLFSSITLFSSSCNIPFREPLLKISEEYHLDFLSEFLESNKLEEIENSPVENDQGAHEHGTSSEHDKNHGHSKKHKKHHSASSGKQVHQIDHSILWVQNSAEYSALCHQAYNNAAYRLEEKLNKYESKKKAAIILDLDETVLDNSPFSAKLFLDNKDYSDTAWDKWVELADAEAIPGAKTFLDEIDPSKVEIFYVSNRHIKHLDATFENLKKLEIPVKKENILLREDSSSKELRRELIAENHEILLLIGDNLIDFTDIFDAHPSSQFRYRLMETLHDEYGDKFIVLPNPNYGQWLSALYNYNYDLSREEKFDIAKQSLLSF